MSPRAACRLESLGFTAVYDYAAGKSDWTGSGLATEGTHASMPRPGRLVRQVPTCGLSDTIATARDRAGETGVCIVTTNEGIVLGRLSQTELEGDADAKAEDVMEAGPTTIRYDEPLPELVGRMQERGVDSILVTTPSGHLVGLMERRDAEDLMAELHRSHHG